MIFTATSAYDFVYCIEKNNCCNIIVHVVIYRHWCPVVIHYRHLLVILTQPIVDLVGLLVNVSAAQLLPPADSSLSENVSAAQLLPPG